MESSFVNINNQPLFNAVFVLVAFKQLLVLIIEQQLTTLNKCQRNFAAAHIQNVAIAYHNVGVFACFD